MSRKEWMQGTALALFIFTVLIIGREYVVQPAIDADVEIKPNDLSSVPIPPVVADPAPSPPVLKPVVVPPVTITQNLTRPYCMTKYGTRSFIKPKPKATPPSLWTFPGSGNTWTRLLIEYATGYYTGSVYDDNTLLSTLPGEYTCDSSTVMIKAHPHTHPFSVIDNGPFSEKCGSITRFDKAVLLIRDPYDAVWSEFQRRVTGSHTGKITRRNFSRERWARASIGLAHEFRLMWERSYIPYMLKYPDGYLMVRYEDLKDQSVRLGVLEKVLALAGRKQSEERMECAFLLANNPAIHRGDKRGAVDAAVTKDDVYSKELVCKMWTMFGTAAMAMGYGIRGDVNCSDASQSTGSRALRRNARV